MVTWDETHSFEGQISLWEPLHCHSANSLEQQVSSGSDLLKDLVNKKVSLRPSLKWPWEEFACLPHATCLHDYSSIGSGQWLLKPTSWTEGWCIFDAFDVHLLAAVPWRASESGHGSKEKHQDFNSSIVILSFLQSQTIVLKQGAIWGPCFV